MFRLLRTCACLMIFVVGKAYADDGPSADAIKAAVAKSLPLLEKGAKGSIEQRKQCFNCLQTLSSTSTTLITILR